MIFDRETWPSRVFVTGIDTDAGKSYATGWLAAELLKRGIPVITQKFVQTGNSGYSEDIEVHRKITGTGILEVDRTFLTAPEIFSYPASPDLAARIDGRELDLKRIEHAADRLAEEYENVIIEGAGGLMVPLKGDYLTIDYIRDKSLPVVLVTNGRLGSISHTLLAVEAIGNAGIPLLAVVYNPYFDKDSVICEDTRRYISNWIRKRYPATEYLEMPSL